MSDEMFTFEEKPTTCAHCGRRLNEGRCPWCDPDHRKGRHRSNDRSTSMDGAASVAYRAGSQKARLLDQYKQAGPEGLTDDEAASSAGLMKSCYWKRCGELRQDGVIVETGVTRPGEAGVQRIVCVWNPENPALENDDRNRSTVPVPADASPTLHQRDYYSDQQRLAGERS